MAPRGSTKALSLLAEDRAAKAYGGKRDPSSGAHTATKGDVKSATRLIESKHRGTYDKPAKSASVTLETMERITDVAYAEGRIPLLHLSLYAPDSALANDAGFVDLSVLLMDQHAAESEFFDDRRDWYC